MEIQQNNINQITLVNANKIIAKYKNKKDRALFCQEKNWWAPEEPGFDSSYFLQVVAGRKKYLPANFTPKYKLGYFRTGARLDKKYIIGKMNGNAAYGDYVPDNCNPFKLSKEFLLTLVAYVDPQLYAEFYNSYKEEIQKRNYKKWSDYNVEINNNLINDIENFVPVNQNEKNKGGFRLFKNKQSTNVFNPIQNINQQNNRMQYKQPIVINENMIIPNLNPISNNAKNLEDAKKMINMDLEPKISESGKNSHIKIQKNK